MFSSVTAERLPKIKVTNFPQRANANLLMRKVEVLTYTKFTNQETNFMYTSSSTIFHLKEIRCNKIYSCKRYRFSQADNIPTLHQDRISHNPNHNSSNVELKVRNQQ